MFAARDRFGIKPLFYARARRHAVLRVGGEGAVRGRRAGALGCRVRVPRGRIRRPPDPHAVRRRASGAAGPLPARDRQARAASSLLGLQLPRRPTSTRGRGRTPSTSPSSVRRWTTRCGCVCAPTCRSAAISAAASIRAPCWAWRRGIIRDPIRAFTLTFDRGDYDEEAEATEMAARAGAEFHPIPIRQDDLADHFADAIVQSRDVRINAHGVAKYLLEPRRPRRRLQGRDHGRRIGRDPRRLRALPPRHAALQPRRAGSRPTSRSCWSDLEQANPVSRGLLLPHGAGAAARARQARRSASCRRGSRRFRRARSRCAALMSPTRSSRTFGARATLSPAC